MLHHAFLAASAVFHGADASASADSYQEAVRAGPWPPGRLAALTPDDTARLVRTVNRWASRYPSSPAAHRALHAALLSAAPLLQALAGETLLDADFARPIDPAGTTVADAVDRAFCAVARAGGRADLTAASKILHLINPGLFVMWDAFIRAGCAITSAPGSGPPPPEAYAGVFLPRMQQLVRLAVALYAREHRVTRAEAARALCSRGQTLAKLVDEYNYAKFTLRDPAVWAAEYEQPAAGAA